jgi:molybdate transport system regulatory protein
VPVAVDATLIVPASQQEFMALSARNRLAGTITSIETDGLMVEVVIELSDGQAITATITKGSVERLGLAEGDEASAVIKATEVMVEN